jgi:hypothetical protein
MSKRYPGNFVTGNPVALSQTSNNGIWDVKDVSTAVSAGVWQEPDGNYEIAKSLRFKVAANGSSGSYLSRTPTSAGNRRTWTWSGWVKRTRLDTGYINGLFEANDPSNTQIVAGIRLETDGTLKILDYNSGYTTHVITTQVFRDVSAWYHIMVAYDTTQANSSDRVKLYVNGQQVTSFSTATYPSLNSQGYINTAGGHYVGACIFGSVIEFLDGYMAEVNFIDGQALDASYFGYTDGVTGNWHPKKYTGSYGQNGFYLPFKSDALTYQVGPFNGSTQTLTAAGNTAFDLTGDFCIETWMYPTSVPDPTGIWSLQPSSGGSGIRLTYEASQIRCALISGVGTLYTELNGSSLPLNMWHHVAVTRSGSAFKMFVNGVVVASATNTGWAGTSSPLIIGGARNYGNGSPFYFTGVLSNFRIVKGYPVYTSNFIPPTSPLAAIPGTSILTCQSATIVDNGPNAITISNNNTVSTAQTIPWLALDNSGNGNNYAPQGPISVTPGVNFDLMVDSPTNVFTSATDVGGVVSGNYCTWNPLSITTSGGTTPSIIDAGLNMNFTNNGQWQRVHGSLAIPSTGKYYWEITLTQVVSNISGGNSFNYLFGIADTTPLNWTTYGNDGAGLGYLSFWIDGGSPIVSVNRRTTTASYGSIPTNGQVLMVAVDMDNNKIYWGLNGTWFNSGNPVTGANPGLSGQIVSSNTYVPAMSAYAYNGVQNPIISHANFGQRTFAYTPPTGFKSLNTTNIQALGTSAVPNVAIQPNKYFDVTTYGGNGGNQTVTNSGFEPDLVWIKRRNGTSDHVIQDSQRGFGNGTKLSSSSSYSESVVDASYTDPKWGYVTKTNSNGFEVTASTNGDQTNLAGAPYVAWQWKSSTATGLNIIPYTGNGVISRAISHSLGVTPKMILFKRRSGSSQDWGTYHNSIGLKLMQLNGSGSLWNSGADYWYSAPTSSNFYPDNSAAGDNYQNINGVNYIAYLFAEVPGFSKIGSWIGNGATDGPFIYTGFRPKFIIVKSVNVAGQYWDMLDAARDPFNMSIRRLYPNASDGEDTAGSYDFCSNGFKIRTSSPSHNSSGNTMIYIAFAESPFALNNRAR